MIITIDENGFPVYEVPWPDGKYTEFYCEFKDGKKDWVDPVIRVIVSTKEIHVYGGAILDESEAYIFYKDQISSWIIRNFKYGDIYLKEKYE